MREHEPVALEPASGAVSPGRDFAAWWWVAVVLLAAVPSLWTLEAPLVAEDAGLLGIAHREGALADWARPQGGLHLLAFWRPLVSMSWAGQEYLTGVDPAPLRAFNLICHALAALGVGLVVRRLGCSTLAALAAGGMAALFPEQGGTVTWVAGRTDGMVSLLMVFTCVLALDRRAVAALLLAFLACAVKEMAFMLPFWVALLLWAREGRAVVGRDVLRRGLLPVVLGVGIALLVRRLALGMWVGGYLASPRTGLLGVVPGAAMAWIEMSALTLVGLAVALGAGLVARTARMRVVLAGLGCALFGAAPLLPILHQGVLSEQNLRLLRVSDLGLCFAAAGVFAAVAGARRRWLALPVIALLLLAGARGGRALSDTREWAAAGEAAEAAIQRARDEAAKETPGPEPLLFDGFPSTHGGAYCLSYCIADRFRAPFPVPPRAIWPLRPAYGQSRSERAPVAPIQSGFVRPYTADPGRVPLVEVTVDGTKDFATIPLDERAAGGEPDRSPRLEVHGRYPDCYFEFVLYTEMGYEPSPWRAAGEGEEHAITLAQLVHLSERVVAPPAELLRLTADFGAQRAWLEVRAVRIVGGEVAAASRFLQLSWDEDLLDRLDRLAPAPSTTSGG